MLSTDKQTNATKNITSFAKEVINHPSPDVNLQTMPEKISYDSGGPFSPGCKNVH